MIKITIKQAKILLYLFDKFYGKKGVQDVSRNEIIEVCNISKSQLSKIINNKFILENKIKEKDEK